MIWAVTYLPEAIEDFKKLDGSQKSFARKAIKKVAHNPLPDVEGGYGKPLGNKNQTNLSGFLKIKLRGPGLRIVYQLKRQDDEMRVIIIGARKDDEVYNTAFQRIQKYNL